MTPQEEEAVEQRRLRRASAPCPAAGAWTGNPGGVPVGGNIRPPAKLRDVRPEYPAALRAAKVGGTVNMEARIGTDGTVREMRADPSAHPDLAAAAMEAVRGWRFDETLLNCVPIEVSMNVSVTFRPRQ